MKLTKLFCLSASLFFQARFVAPQFSNSVFMFADWTGCSSAGISYKPEMLTSIIDGVQRVNAVFKSCSFGAADPDLLMDASNIITTPFPIPCSGRLSEPYYNQYTKLSRTVIIDYDFSVTGCNQGISISLMQRALMSLVNVSGVQYFYWLNLPNKQGCPYWSGGAGGITNAGNGWGEVEIGTNQMAAGIVGTFIHENGHMLTLGHSGTPSDDYGDSSCPMGCGSFDSCYNAPHSSQLGWTSSLAKLIMPLNPDNIWRTFLIPIYTRVPKNHIVIDLQQPSIEGGHHRLFLSVRSKEGNPTVDQHLSSAYEKTVSIHSTSRDINYSPTIKYNNYYGMPTFVIGQIKNGKTFDFFNVSNWIQDPASFSWKWMGPKPVKIAIKHISYTSNVGSNIAICFYASKMESCIDDAIKVITPSVPSVAYTGLTTPLSNILAKMPAVFPIYNPIMTQNFYSNFYSITLSKDNVSFTPDIPWVPNYV